MGNVLEIYSPVMRPGTTPEEPDERAPCTVTVRFGGDSTTPDSGNRVEFKACLRAGAAKPTNFADYWMCVNDDTWNKENWQVVNLLGGELGISIDAIKKRVWEPYSVHGPEKVECQLAYRVLGWEFERQEGQRQIGEMLVKNMVFLLGPEYYRNPWHYEKENRPSNKSVAKLEKSDLWNDATNAKWLSSLCLDPLEKAVGTLFGQVTLKELELLSLYSDVGTKALNECCKEANVKEEKSMKEFVDEMRDVSQKYFQKPVIASFLTLEEIRLLQPLLSSYVAFCVASVGTSRKRFRDVRQKDLLDKAKTEKDNSRLNSNQSKRERQGVKVHTVPHAKQRKVLIPVPAHTRSTDGGEVDEKEVWLHDQIFDNPANCIQLFLKKRTQSKSLVSICCSLVLEEKCVTRDSKMRVEIEKPSRMSDRRENKNPNAEYATPKSLAEYAGLALYHSLGRRPRATRGGQELAQLVPLTKDARQRLLVDFEKMMIMLPLFWRVQTMHDSKWLGVMLGGNLGKKSSDWWQTWNASQTMMGYQADPTEATPVSRLEQACHNHGNFMHQSGSSGQLVMPDTVVNASYGPNSNKESPVTEELFRFCRFVRREGAATDNKYPQLKCEYDFNWMLENEKCDVSFRPVVHEPPDGEPPIEIDCNMGQVMLFDKDDYPTENTMDCDIDPKWPEEYREAWTDPDGKEQAQDYKHDRHVPDSVRNTRLKIQEGSDTEDPEWIDDSVIMDLQQSPFGVKRRFERTTLGTAPLVWDSDEEDEDGPYGGDVEMKDCHYKEFHEEDDDTFDFNAL